MFSFSYNQCENLAGDVNFFHDCFRILQSHEASYYFLGLEVFDTCYTAILHSLQRHRKSYRVACLSGKFSNHALVFSEASSSV